MCHKELYFFFDVTPSRCTFRYNIQESCASILNGSYPMRCLSRGVVLDKIGMLTTPNFISLFPQSFDSYWLGLGDEKIR